MRSCCNCTISSKTYCISNNFKKYIKYIQSSCNYNLAISFASIKQIYKKQIHLKKEVHNIYVKLSRLEKQLDFQKKIKNKKIVTK